jgi:hypothetical protein
VDALAKEMLSNPLIETYAIEPLEVTSSAVSSASGATQP